MRQACFTRLIASPKVGDGKSIPGNDRCVGFSEKLGRSSDADGDPSRLVLREHLRTRWAIQKASAPANQFLGAGLLHRNFLSFEDSMHTLIVLDHTGDSRHPFDPNDCGEVLDAERRFRELSRAGYIAAKRTGNGSEVTRQFDPTVKETLFIPRLVGG
jgi:hypothetical protein